MSQSRKAIIKLTYRCNNRCLFCRALPRAEIQTDLDTQAAMRKIVRARELGVDMVLFSGGEPTLRRDLFKLIRAVLAMDMKFGLITNARRLAYPKYFDRLMDAGPSYIHTSLLGATAKTHNALTKADSFDDLIKALENMRTAGIPEIHVNTVITAMNRHELKAMADLLNRFAPLTFKLTLMEPTGLYENNETSLFLAPLTAAESAIDALNYGLSEYGNTGLRMGIEGFPLCMIRGYESYVENMMTQGILYMSEVYESGFYPVDHGERQFFHACHLCSRKLECPGQFPGYGSDGLTPFTDQVPLAFPMINQENAETGAPEPGTQCPVFKWTRQQGLGERNGLCLMDKGATVYYGFQDGHADGLLVQRLKDAGQVYLDQRAQAVKAGTPVQVPVQKNTACDSCDIAEACPWVYQRFQANQYYRRLDEKIIRLLQQIGGKVIDLGCSRSYYTPVLMDMLEDGRITYTGVDPHANLDMPEAVNKGARFVKTQPEQADLPARSADWVLILDSINSFSDPISVLERAWEWLVSDGGILIVDRNPFILLTDQQKTTWGMGARNRNGTLAEVVHWLEETGFKPSQMSEPVPGRTNLWFVLAMKTDG